MRKSLVTIVTLAGLVVMQCHGNVGWTLEECVQHYGKEVSKPVEHKGATMHHFRLGKLEIYAFISGKGSVVTGMAYRKLNRKAFSTAEIAQLLNENAVALNSTLHRQPSGLATSIGQKNLKPMLTAKYDLLDGGLGYSLMIAVQDSSR